MDLHQRPLRAPLVAPPPLLPGLSPVYALVAGSEGWRGRRDERRVLHDDTLPIEAFTQRPARFAGGDVDPPDQAASQARHACVLGGGCGRSPEDEWHSDHMSLHR